MSRLNHHLVIMAGGAGDRFWPVSTAETPKQFVDVLGTGRTLIQMTLDRFGGLFEPDRVWVVTHERYAGLVRAQLPEVPADHVLLEPCSRGTAPCIAYVSWCIKMADPKANVVVTPADHLVTDVEAFRRVIGNGLTFTSETDAILTVGTKPMRPETRYGYIQADLSSNSARNKGVFRVDQFHEKPDLATATRYIQEGNYYWNTGIFIWSVETIVNALRIYAPRINRIFERQKDVLDTPEGREAVAGVYADCEGISLDHAVLERAEEFFVCPASFGWSDLGAWSSLLLDAPHDLYGNAVVGKDVKLVDCRNCMVHTSQERKVVLQGLDNCIVAERDGVLLVCQLSEEQRIAQFI